MILVDTAIWVDHLNASDPRLLRLLDNDDVLTHPFVIGEIMLGSLKDRDEVREALEGLRQSSVADDVEVMRLIEAKKLAGTGIGYVDAHLLASVLLTRKAQLWTRDRRLSAVAAHLSIGYEALH